MSTPVTNVSQTQPADQSQLNAATASRKAKQATGHPVPKDTVTLSPAAQTPQQELSETHAQTVHEANAGDAQAIRRLAQQAASARANLVR
jgi:hypothetical protein